EPVAHCFVDGVFERARTEVHAAYFSAQQTHAEDVEFLSAHVLGAHVDDALEAEQSADRSGGNAVLASPGFSDYAMLAHALDQQCLAKAVVDFVSASVEQVFALKVDFGAAELFGKAAGKEERSGASSVSPEEEVQALLVFRIPLGFEIGRAHV